MTRNLKSKWGGKVEETAKGKAVASIILGLYPLGGVMEARAFGEPEKKGDKHAQEVCKGTSRVKKKSSARRSSMPEDKLGQEKKRER